MGREENVIIFKDTEKLCETIDELKQAIKSSKEKLEDAYSKFNDYLKAKQLAKAKNNETNVEEM